MWSPQPILRASIVIIVTLAPAVAAAQDWGQPWSDPRDRPPRVDVSMSLGMVAPTDWSDLVLLGSISPSGILEQVLVRDLRVEPDIVYGGTVTYWRDRYGFRSNVELSRSSVVFAGGAVGTFPPPETGDLIAAKLDTWYYDVRGAIGLVDYSPSRRTWPYVFVGLGAITYDLERTIGPPLLTFIERTTTRPAGPGDIVIVEDEGRQFLLAIDELGLETVFAFNFGVGTDLRLPLGRSGVGLRLELSDHVAPSPLQLRIREIGVFGGLPSEADVEFGIVHHLRASVGVVLQFGK
jgi:hypothetical protein